MGAFCNSLDLHWQLKTTFLAASSCMHNLHMHICVHVGTPLSVNCVIKDNFRKELYKKIRSFSYNSFVKYLGKKIWEPQLDSVKSKSVLY